MPREERERSREGEQVGARLLARHAQAGGHLGEPASEAWAGGEAAGGPCGDRVAEPRQEDEEDDPRGDRDGRHAAEDRGASAEGERGGPGEPGEEERRAVERLHEDEERPRARPPGAEDAPVERPARHLAAAERQDLQEERRRPRDGPRAAERNAARRREEEVQAEGARREAERVDGTARREEPWSRLREAAEDVGRGVGHVPRHEREEGEPEERERRAAQEGPPAGVSRGRRHGPRRPAPPLSGAGAGGSPPTACG